jgi:hypothetical protein
LGAGEDRVLGSLHLEKALRGQRVFDPGLLAAANRGILYIDEMPRPSEPWHVILNKIVPHLLIEPFRTFDCHEEVKCDGWNLIVTALREHEQGLSLPPGVESPEEVVPAELRHKLWLQWCFNDLSGLGQEKELTLEDPEEHYRIEWFIEEVEGVPKLGLYNEGPGMGGDEISRLMDLASTGKKLGIDNNYGQGGKISALKVSQHGVVYRSCQAGRVSQIILAAEYTSGSDFRKWPARLPPYEALAEAMLRWPRPVAMMCGLAPVRASAVPTRPAPSTNTRAGATVPAAVISSGKNLPVVFAASSTAL